MGKTTTHPDGSTTTPGTQITTDQGTGEAKAETETKTQETGDKQKDPEKGQIDLNKELGDARKDLTWDGVDAEAGKDQEEKAKFNGYTIQESKPSEDGNSKELTLKKTETGKEKHLSAEDIAKLMDESEHLDKKEDGSYTLKKTEDILDEEGKVIGTRTTVYQITRDSVQTTTETTLKIRMDKGTKPDEKDLNTEIEQPDIKDEKTQEVILPSTELENILKDPTTVKKDDGTYIYTKTIQNEDGTTTIREYTITKTDEARDLTYQELADRLGEDFTGDQDGVYYKGEKLTVEQMEAKRHALRYQVQIKETHKTFDQVSGKDEAETAAKTDAIKDALRKAAKEYDITLTEDDLKDIKLTGGDLVVTRDGKKYTFHYTEAGVEYSAPIATDDTTVDGKDAEDVKETTVTGTAYVTSGTISWTKNGEKGEYTASGIINPGEYAAKKPEIPEGALKSTNANGEPIYTVTTKNPDGSTTETIYTFREAVVSLSSPEAKQAAWDALAKAENKTVAELQAEGYTITGINFGSITKSTWTVETRTHKTETTEKTLNQTLVDDTWTLEGTTLKIKGGETYTGLKQNPDGTYTATQKDGDKTTTYTFTLGEVKDLDEPTIKAMLAKEFPVSVDAIELKDGHATYKDGETTVTIDYRNLSKKTLKIDTSVSEAVSVTETIKDGDKAALEAAQERLYQELKKKVESITLKEGETLWIGDLEIKDIDSQRTQIIEKFTTAVSHENMSQQALIAALNAQADEAKNQTVVVNKGTKYEETLNNYYSGNKNLQHNPKKPPLILTPGKGDNITHLDLASGAKMNKLSDKDGNVTQTDCVLLAKNQKLEWNYDADKLVKGDGNTTVGLKKYISKDTEDGKGSYHYEYDRLRGEGENKNPERSAFYKLTGTVAYDSLKQSDGTTCKFRSEDEAQWYLDRYMSNLSTEEKKGLNPQIVTMYTDQNYTEQGKIYKVYLRTSDLTTYGYMSKDSNTCVNSSYGTDRGRVRWAGGFDLRIDDLTQIDEKTITAHGRNVYTCTGTLSKITSKLEEFSKELNLIPTHKTTTSYEYQVTGGDNGQFGSYDQTYTQNKTYETAVKGTDSSSYVTYKTWQDTTATWKDVLNKITGFFKFNYTSTDDAKVTEATKKTDVHTESSVGYHYSYVESSEPIIVPPVTPPVDPDTPDGPVEDETPDEVVTPETPELPPVQDATPDDAAPETPVLPSDAVLPAVQDALPQTGVNWMAALGMAFSGMLLTIAGAFASLKYKEKH